MTRTNWYSPEVRERAVRMVVEHLDDYSSEWVAISSVSSKLGMKPETHRVWRRRAQNALAESFNGLYKAELIYHEGPWKGIEDVEWATLAYVDWLNHKQLHGEFGMVTPAMFETTYYDQAALVDDASLETIESL